jgi:N-acetylglucosaminyldiphosphoundecaprenol N-acetyl-beta-D-mannosaminyltransferase
MASILKEKESAARRPAPGGVAAIPSSSEILGIRIHNVTMNETIARLEHMSLNGGRHHLATVNPEFVVLAQRDAAFRNILNNVSLSLPDGIGILLASRILGVPMQERVAGVDVISRFAEVAGKKNLRIFLLGAAPGVAEEAARVLESRNSGLKIAGTYAGSPDPREDETIRRLIRAAKPHVVLVAYGAPKQEYWIARNLPHLDVPVAIGVGGSFDFIAGIAARAPVWIQSAGLEWLHRLLHQPRRWRRMLALPRFAGYVLIERLKYVRRAGTTSVRADKRR